MPAAPIIFLVAAETGVAATIGTAIVGSAVSTGVATAVGTAVIAGGVSAAQGNDAGQVLQDALLGGVTSVIGSEIASGVNQSLVEAGVPQAAAAPVSTAARTIKGAAGMSELHGVNVDPLAVNIRLGLGDG